MVLKRHSPELDDEVGSLLRSLPPVAPSRALEERLRQSFRRVGPAARPHAAPQALAIIGVAAVVTLAVASALLRPGGSRDSEAAGSRVHAAVSAVDLDGFQPVARPRLLRLEDERTYP